MKGRPELVRVGSPENVQCEGPLGVISVFGDVIATIT